MPKWLDLNEVDDDEILLKKNRMSRSLVLDTPEVSEVADAAEEDFLDTMEPAKKSMTIFFMIDVSGSMKGTEDWFFEQYDGGIITFIDWCWRGFYRCEDRDHEVFYRCRVGDTGAGED